MTIPSFVSNGMVFEGRSIKIRSCNINKYTLIVLAYGVLSVIMNISWLYTTVAFFIQRLFYSIHFVLTVCHKSHLFVKCMFNCVYMSFY